jgi:uncharacterized membrane protein YuzA (DUF378 family)
LFNICTSITKTISDLKVVIGIIKWKSTTRSYIKVVKTICGKVSKKVDHIVYKIVAFEVKKRVFFCHHVEQG